MREKKIINTPLTDEVILSLTAGEFVYITGDLYTGRDAAHQRMYNAMKNGEDPPFSYEGQIIYYAGPCPNKPGQVIGSIGPTTSGRMDAFTPFLVEKGLKAMIGKGTRSAEVIEALKSSAGVYFAAIGGAAALMSQCVESVELVAYEDLGTEAIRKLTVKELPVVVAVDHNGNSVYSNSNNPLCTASDLELHKSLS